MKEEKNYMFPLMVMVAIVAIVGIVMMVVGVKTQTQYVPVAGQSPYVESADISMARQESLPSTQEEVATRAENLGGMARASIACWQNCANTAIEQTCTGPDATAGCLKTWNQRCNSACGIKGKIWT